MTTTVSEFATKQGIDNVTANAVLNFLESKGQAKVVELRKSATGKGRAAKVFEVADTVTFSL
jgi:predicted ArsR family transcriptional regulator